MITKHPTAGWARGRMFVDLGSSHSFNAQIARHHEYHQAHETDLVLRNHAARDGAPTRARPKALVCEMGTACAIHTVP